MNNQEEIDLKELCEAILSKKVFIILCIILGVWLGVAYTLFIVTPKYSSSVTFILSKPVGVTSEGTQAVLDDDSLSITQSDITLNQKLVSTYGEIMKSKKVISQVINNLGSDESYENLNKCISTTSVDDTEVIKVTVATEDAKFSCDVANELIDVFSGEVVKIYNIQNISVIDNAYIADEPDNVNMIKNVIIFALIMGAIAVGIVFIGFYFDNTIKSGDDIEKIFGFKVIAAIPEFNSFKGGKAHGKRK